MVTIFSRLFFFICFTTSVWAAEFTAQVNTNQVTKSQPIYLTLTVIDTKPTSSPDLTSLNENFNILSQQKYSSYQIINGTKSSEIVWKITLMPKKTGEINIPTLSIKTKQGILHTNALDIEVQANSSISDNTAENSDKPIFFTSSLNKHVAHPNELLIYKLKLFHTKNLTISKQTDISVDNAIVQRLQEPKSTQEYINNKLTHVVEIHYAILPLTNDSVSIKPMTLQGEIETEHPHATHSPFGLFDPFFSHVQHEPFEISSDPLSIAIKPLQQPLLPLYELKIKDDWNHGTDHYQEGDIIPWHITIEANGTFGKQLPDLNSLLNINGIKVYADKVDTTEHYNAKQSELIGRKSITLNLSLQKSGNITIPDIEIPWWNLKTQSIETTVLPGKQLNIASQVPTAYIMPETSLTPSKDQTTLSEAEISNFQLSDLPNWVFGIFSGLISIILILLSYIIYLLKARHHSQKQSSKATNLATDVHSIEDLNTYILEIATLKWQLSPPQGIAQLFESLESNGYQFDKNIAHILKSHLQAALYNKQAIDLHTVKTAWGRFEASVVMAKKMPITLRASSLNPT